MPDLSFFSEQFLSALQAEQICLHPTDTLPGLTFNPHSHRSIEQLAAIKKRGNSKNFIGLVFNLAAASEFWLPLPINWLNFLNRAWPGPLSVVWHASPKAPGVMVSAEGTICLRVAKFSPADRWMDEVLRQLTYPLPTTSVNISGQSSLVARDELLAFAGNNGVFVPAGLGAMSFDAPPVPSTVLRIIDENNFEILRDGAVSNHDIVGWLHGA